MYLCWEPSCTLFLYKQPFNSSSVLLSWTFSWIELQMLLRCRLIHITIIILSILHLLYFGPSICLGLFMSYLCDLFVIFSLIFIAVNLITSDALILSTIFRISPIIFKWWRDEESEKLSNNKSSVSGCCLVFAWFFASSSLVLLIKVLRF